MNTKTYLLGLDCGGTRTVCLLADGQGHVLGRGVAGPSNYHAVGLEAATNAILQAVDQAWQAAGLARGVAAVACLGLAGVDRPEDRQAITTALTPRRLARRLLIVNDAVIVLAAGSGGGVGVVVIAGTGSIAWGRNRDGQDSRAGGWGHILGDEGSAHDIGLRALQAVMRARDERGQPTVLTDFIFKHLRLARPESLLTFVHTLPYPRAEIAALAPIVERAARQGDPVACTIYAHAAQELALAATTVIQALGMEGEAVDVVLSGGVFHAGELVIEPFVRAVREIAPQAQAIRLEQEPAVGAVRLAVKELGNHRTQKKQRIAAL